MYRQDPAEGKSHGLSILAKESVAVAAAQMSFIVAQSEHDGLGSLLAHS
jgi:hypothetical protein